MVDNPFEMSTNIWCYDECMYRSKCSLHQKSYNTPTTLAEYIKRKFICTSLFKDMLPTTIREIYRYIAVRYQAFPTPYNITMKYFLFVGNQYSWDLWLIQSTNLRIQRNIIYNLHLLAYHLFNNINTISIYFDIIFSL